MLLEKKTKSILFVAELNKRLFVISEASPRCGWTGPLQGELCAHEQRAHSAQSGSHPARTQQCQDHFSPVTACLWRHTTDNLSQKKEEGVVFSRGDVGCWCFTMNVPCKPSQSRTWGWKGFAPGAADSQTMRCHWIMELVGLEKASKVIKPNHHS